MPDIYLTNSLTNKKEKIVPIKPPVVSIYTCGPTVYDYAQIGNFRTYITADLIVRLFGYNSFDAKYVMNLTDVGHLTGDNLGDADTGEDRVEKAAKREGKSAWDITNFYATAFEKDMKALNIRKPWNMPKASDHIKEQIGLVKALEGKGVTYKTSDGIYFDTGKFEEVTGKVYGELSTLKNIKEGARVAKNVEKRNARDFALWKFSYPSGRAYNSAKDDESKKRQMEWESPWGLGFPGWHLECSAMSMKYLGGSFDVHIGGEDLRSTHHPNEIAQSETVTGEKFVNHWVHVTFLKIKDKRMGKSLKNVYTISDIKAKGCDPIALRYLYLTAHYKDSLNFTWGSLESSQNALDKLKGHMAVFQSQKKRTSLSAEKQNKLNVYMKNFVDAVNDDLNTPKALAVLWEVVKSNVPSRDKYDLCINFDEVLGLGLGSVAALETKIPEDVAKLIKEREKLRIDGDFKAADKVRLKIENKGFQVADSEKGPNVKRNVN